VASLERPAAHDYSDTAIGGGSTLFRYVPLVAQVLSHAWIRREGSDEEAAIIRMTQDASGEAAWLRFLLHRVRAALRYARTAETMAICQELIQEIEKRLEIDTKLTAWHRVNAKGSFRPPGRSGLPLLRAPMTAVDDAEGVAHTNPPRSPR
jgi:hypothetical protein